MNGLASNTVGAVIQDREGFMWLATDNGFQRYDGSSFITFRHEKDVPTSIPSTHILSIYMDRKKNIWLIGSNNKLGTFDTRNFLFHEATVETNEPVVLKQLFESNTRDLLLLVEGGDIYLYEPGPNKFTRVKNYLPFPSKWKADRITWDPFVQRFWATCDSGIIQIDPRTRHANYRGHNADHDPVINSFESITRPSGIFIDGKGNVLFNYWETNAGGPTQYRYKRNENRVEKYYMGVAGYHEIFWYLQQRNGRLWVYGLPFFAEWKDNAASPFSFLMNQYRNEQSIKFDYTFAAFEDKESNIWIGTDNGLFIFNPDRQIFNAFNLVRPDGKPPVEVPVTSMQEMADGNFFVGCWNSAGIFYFDRDFNPLPMPAVMNKFRNLSIWDMAIQPQTGELWVTLQGGGIGVYDQKKNTCRLVYPEIFQKSTIRQVDEDTTGNLWFGTQSGKLIKWDYRKSHNDPSKGYELIYQTQRIHKVHYDYQGFIWVCTLGDGLLKIDAKTGKMVRTFNTTSNEGERLFMDAPGDITYYNDTTLIVSAGCINVINTRTNKVRFISTDESLPSNTVQSVQRGQNGILWAGMSSGICRLNLPKGLITSYDRRDGIAIDKFEMGGVKQVSDGRLVFFTDHNFLVFDPSKVVQNHRPSNPIITAFKLGERSLSLDSIRQNKRAVLKYNNTSIVIGFSALTYLQQQKVHYFYMMEGLDKDWILVDHPTQVVYNYLSPGTYTFKVKSESADGIASERTASLVILVRAPVWQTWWFYSLIALLVIAVLYLLDRERMNKLNSLRDIRRQIRLNLRNEVSNTLNNINVLSEIAKIKADKNVDQAKDFIDQISDKSRHMAQALDDTLWTIDPANDSMKKLVLRLKELTEGMRVDYETGIDLIVDHKVQSLALDMKLRHELFFFYKEALLFIVEHMFCNQVFVNFNKVKSKLMVEMLCDCEEYSDDIKARFLNALDRRIKAMPATIDVVSDNKSFAVVLYVDIR